MMFVLAACGDAELTTPAPGTYRQDFGNVSINVGWFGFGGDVAQEWTFMSGNRINIQMGMVTASGTYEVIGDRLIVTSQLGGIFGSFLDETTVMESRITGITCEGFFLDGMRFARQGTNWRCLFGLS